MYGRNCEGLKVLGLADAIDIDNFRIKLERLKRV